MENNISEIGIANLTDINVSLSLDVPYPYQWVSNEELKFTNTNQCNELCTESFGHGPILKGTLTGEVNFNGVSKVTFNSSFNSDVIEIGTWIVDADFKIESISMDYLSGQLKLVCSKPVDPNSVSIIVNYEYDYANEKAIKYPQYFNKQQVIVE